MTEVERLSERAAFWHFIPWGRRKKHYIEKLLVIGIKGDIIIVSIFDGDSSYLPLSALRA